MDMTVDLQVRFFYIFQPSQQREVYRSPFLRPELRVYICLQSGESPEISPDVGLTLNLRTCQRLLPA
jgi:hypothetical protein